MKLFKCITWDLGNIFFLYSPGIYKIAYTNFFFCFVLEIGCYEQMPMNKLKNINVPHAGEHMNKFLES